MFIIIFPLLYFPYNNYRATEHYVELDIISEIKNIIVGEFTDFELIFLKGDSLHE